MAAVFETTRFVTCVPPQVGGSGNPSQPTAKGVVCAMEAALDHLGLGTLAGKTVAMQGAGNVAGFMIDELRAKGCARIVATEISAERCAELRARHAAGAVEIREVGVDDRTIFAEPCDIFAPNALGGVLAPETIAMLRARIVCGAANNQLLDDRRDDRLLAERGVLYVPDFVANRMGIVSCANEQYGNLPQDPAIERHFGRSWDNSVYAITKRVLERAAAEGITTSTAANALADEACAVPHPIWGHRSRAILESLVRDGF
jgi:glutamate dehydrogenase/leucine dehydrogenase